jgi:hypothetical protein
MKSKVGNVNSAIYPFQNEHSGMPTFFMMISKEGLNQIFQNGEECNIFSQHDSKTPQHV